MVQINCAKFKLNKLNTHQQKGTELFVNEEKDTVVNLPTGCSKSIIIGFVYLILFAMHRDQVMLLLWFCLCWLRYKIKWLIYENMNSCCKFELRKDWWWKGKDRDT